MAVGFGADGEAAEAADPGVGAFDDPAAAGEGVGGAGDALASAGAGSGGLAGRERVAWSAAFADQGGDRAVAQLVAERVAAVAAVGEDVGGLVAVGAQFVDQWQQMRALVLVAWPQADCQGPPEGVYREVILGAGKPAVDGAWTDQVAPFLASTIEASTTTRCQSSLPA